MYILVFFSELLLFSFFFFFFQAEDGIRDLTVTGVQTCALPILLPHVVQYRHSTFPRQLADRIEQRVGRATARRELDPYHPGAEAADEIGRASCRERV